MASAGEKVNAKTVRRDRKPFITGSSAAHDDGVRTRQDVPTELEDRRWSCVGAEDFKGQPSLQKRPQSPKPQHAVVEKIKSDILSRLFQTTEGREVWPRDTGDKDLCLESSEMPLTPGRASCQHEQSLGTGKAV